MVQRGERDLLEAGGRGSTALNGKPVESVWDFPRPPSVERVDWRIRVAHGGELIVDAPYAMRVLETSQAPAFYVAPEFVSLANLEPAGRQSGCEWKGVASYANVVAGRFTASEAAWTYRDPTPAFAGITDHWAFYAQTLDECWVDDERVEPNDGNFYGGWITNNVTGPYKGAAGTLFW